MESGAKRRKVSHNGDAPKSKRSVAMATASPFVLQTEELLKEVKVDYAETFDGADALLKQIKHVIDGIAPQEAAPISDATRKFQKKHHIQIPFPDPKPAADAPYKLAYAKPAACNVVGSYVSRTMIQGQEDKCVDMIVQMPASLFQDKDFQTMRYFYRRAYYIANIAAGVREALGSSVDLLFENLNENSLLPILTILPKVESESVKKGGSKAGKSEEDDSEEEEGDDQDDDNEDDDDDDEAEYAIRIIPCAPDGLFAKSKLISTANNNKADGADAPTPFYNSTLKAEETFVTYLRVLTRARTQCKAFADACILGRVWLEQRGLGGNISGGGFGHFEWAITMALLLQKGGRNGQAALSSSLSSTELFKATVQFLGSTDFVAKPFVFGTYARGEEAVREAGPVMFDVDRELNVLFKMSPWSANLLKYHAGITLELLNANVADQFEAAFITKVDLPHQMYDINMEIEDIDLERNSAAADRQGPFWNFSTRVHKTLKKALSDRAALIHVKLPEQSAWELDTQPEASTPSVLIGVVFDLANMAKPMEYGPSAESQKEAARFRQFWGDKSELRRFKDGSILECVPWKQTSAAGICEEITRYVLKLHASVEESNIHFYGGKTPDGLEFTPVDKEAFDTARRAFQTMEHDLRSLEDLPLSIRRLAPVVPELRYASLQPPVIGFHKGTAVPMDVTLTFEASSKWPENVVAIQEAKIEFLLDIDRRLKAAKDNITTCLGRDNAVRDSDNLAFLDVVYENGAAFRLRVHSEPEETLLERQAKNKTLDPYVRLAAEETLHKIRWQNNDLPLHTQSIASFCTRLPALSPAIRMTKHWFNSHKLTGHISEELIELLVLHVFLRPHPWKIPSSAQSGFLRTLLFLSRWDWRTQPLVVDFSDDMSPEDAALSQTTLAAWRARDPTMNHAVLFVATSNDPTGQSYTRTAPTKLSATRMTRLAKSAVRLVREQDVALEMDALFEPSLADYDFLLHLSSKETKRVLRDAAADAGARHSAFKNLDARTGKVPLPLARHPVDVLLGELEAAYEDSLIFFRGSRGDAVVGAIWQPKLRRQAFRVGLPFNLSAVGDGAEVEVNKEAVLLEIARIGGDMIKRIEVAE
ncbi:Nucleolar protein 6 [Verticillium nonalfalfae]|uniref:U3 small nucleolar RNA-associated protein 22 n=1 Tax=Verticillium nonalfalfae TaxID=1051616 RepID=A0A3M9Y462_9PEZI|nr:Nucleolar protein 6 [Verticillium nonalfalfae]RNJ54238.1 Nucleolar protein 6 [Verticillium nonalfalfae]